MNTGRQLLKVKKLIIDENLQDTVKETTEVHVATLLPSSVTIQSRGYTSNTLQNTSILHKHFESRYLICAYTRFNVSRRKSGEER